MNRILTILTVPALIALALPASAGTGTTSVPSATHIHASGDGATVLKLARKGADDPAGDDRGGQRRDGGGKHRGGKDDGPNHT
jgi:hypothetical protein